MKLLLLKKLQTGARLQYTILYGTSPHVKYKMNERVHRLLELYRTLNNICIFAFIIFQS